MAVEKFWIFVCKNSKQYFTMDVASGHAGNETAEVQ